MKQWLLLFLLLPVLLTGGTISFELDLPDLRPDAGSGQFEISPESGWAYTTAPGSYRLPVRTVNLILPAGAESVSASYAVRSARTLAGAEPAINTAYTDGERYLFSQPELQPAEPVIFQGMGSWGEVRYARFAVLPALYDNQNISYETVSGVELSVSYQLGDDRAADGFAVPPLLERDASFVNREVLPNWYPGRRQREYDYLIVTTPSLYAAAQPLVSFRQTQGLVTSFADINQVLATSSGATNAEKLRNHLILEYVTSPFSYVLLIGDIDVVPIAYLTPEPNGFDTVPSDFYYSDLSSAFDADNDGRLGEYGTDMDFTPELLVGRIPWNTPADVTAICNRIVSFETSDQPWKHKALLPSAILNYYNEDGNGDYERTDGAVFAEYCINTALRGYETTSLYEQAGLLPSLPSDLPLTANNFSDLLNSQSWGLVNWSAHGSQTSSARKVWMNDQNDNDIPDPDELQWFGLVEIDTFNNPANPDGAVFFCASCLNGTIDHYAPSLGEWLLRQKAVADISATRTGWYKLGWSDPGWGGLSSYNYHFLENYAAHGMTVGQAHAYANWLHTQYCLFGDPVDSGGIIWPELQNIYAYLLYGDPAIGHPSPVSDPEGSILVWEPAGDTGQTVVNGLLDLAAFNVVYTTQLINTYNYLNQFDAVFCLFGLGYGPGTYAPAPGSYEYNCLLSYLQQGGRVYMEGMMSWDPADSLYGRFGTIAPFDHVAFIEQLRYNDGLADQIWDYNGYNGGTQALEPYGGTSQALFYSYNTEHVNDVIGIWNRIGGSRTISSSFNLGGVYSDLYPYPQFLAIILDTLDVYHAPPVSNQDESAPPAAFQLSVHPNPFRQGAEISVKSVQPVQVGIYNLKGQLVRSALIDPDKGQARWRWDGRNSRGGLAAAGVYLVRVRSGQFRRTGKLLKLN